MFEEYTQDYILSDMLSFMPDDLDHSEGSLLWLSLSRMAATTEEIYQNLSEVYDNILVDTQDLEHLISSGAECGVPIHDATGAVMRLKIDCALNDGDQLEAVEADFDYYVTDSLGTTTEKDDDGNETTWYWYAIECGDPGTEANAYLSEVEPVEPNDDFSYGVITEIITAGRDEEDEDDYRMRRIFAFDVKPFAGNRAYYKDQIELMEGVETCFLDRVQKENETLEITIIGEGYTVPSDAVIKQVQEAVDPDASGDGEGIAPIGAKVKIVPVKSLAINVALSLSFYSGYAYKDIQSQVEAAVDDCCKEVAKNMVLHTAAGTVRKAVIEAKIIEIDGVQDVTSIKLNGGDVNISVPVGTIPIKGAVTCS